MLIILWHVDPLLGNDREIIKRTTAVVRSRILQQTQNQQLHCNRGAVFSMLSVRNCYKQGQLAVALGSWQLRPGTVREPRRRGTSAVASCYQATAVKT
jgi:hypothetical protein